MGQHDTRRDKEFPPRWSVAVGILLILLLGAFGVWSQYSTQQEADNASQNANSLADEVTNACAEGSVEIDGRDICTKAKQVKKDVRTQRKLDRLDRRESAAGPVHAPPFPDPPVSRVETARTRTCPDPLARKARTPTFQDQPEFPARTPKCPDPLANAERLEATGRQ